MLKLITQILRTIMIVKTVLFYILMNKFYIALGLTIIIFVVSIISTVSLISCRNL